MNLKKEPGGSQADPNEVKAWVRKHAPYVREQLRIVDPDIVVCGGTLSIVTETNVVDLGRTLDFDETCYRPERAVWVTHHHPSVQGVYGMVLYYSLLALVEQAIRTIPGREPGDSNQANATS